MGQLEQILDAKGRAPCGDRDEGIERQNAGPLGRQRDQPTGVVVEVNPMLTPIVAIGHEGEFTPTERVEGMSDLERLGATAQIGCT
jgi:hypothetical protein